MPFYNFHSYPLTSFFCTCSFLHCENFEVVNITLEFSKSLKSSLPSHEDFSSICDVENPIQTHISFSQHSLKAHPCTVIWRVIVRCVIYFYWVNHTFFESKCSPTNSFHLFSPFFCKDNFCSKE